MKNYKSVDSKVLDEEQKEQVDLLSKKFLYEVYKQVRIKRLNKTKLASMLEVSPGYLSQVFHSKKPLTFDLITRMERVLHIEFEIKAIPGN